jgi:hypothetical protein
VEQYRLVELPYAQIPDGAVVLRSGANPDTYLVLDVAAPKPAFTELEGNFSAALALDADGRVEVTGHSLGGHLGMAFSTIFASRTAEVTVFDAPGFWDTSTNRAFFEKLGGSIPVEGATNITNVIADEALIGGRGAGQCCERGMPRAGLKGRREMTSRKKAKTFWKASAAIALAAALAGCAGWVPGRQSYWDAKVKEMCEKDGGVTIYEKVRVSRADLQRGVLPMSADGMIGPTLKELSHPDAPVYAKRTITYLREANPEVGRVEWTFIRRTDQKIVARSVSYGRRGGDFPSPSHGSSFGCPDPKKDEADLQRLFIVEGDSK